MARARGANATLALGFEAEYGVPPASAYYRTPFVSANLGEEQPLEASDVLGFGREQQDPSRGAVDNAGDVVVPLCARNIGLHLKGLLGAPTTAAGVAASGKLSFSAQPAPNSTVTLAAEVFTFVAAAPAAGEIQIGQTLAATVANAVRAFSASPALAAATYAADARGRVIEIRHVALGLSGNSFSLAAGSSPASNIAVSAATLTGGAASGGYQHTFVSGAAILPSATVEVGMPDVPEYRPNWGCKYNSMGIQLARSGNLNATLNIIAQGEDPASAVSIAGTPTELELARFSNFAGMIRRNGVPIADLTAGQINLANNIDAIPGIGRGDGRITGADEGVFAATGQIGARYSGPELQRLAEDGEASEVEYSWFIPASNFSLRIIVSRLFLPKAKRPITGPGGVQADYNWQASERASLGRSVTVILTNDVPAY